MLALEELHILLLERTEDHTSLSASHAPAGKVDGLLVDRFQGQHLIIVGDLMLDRYIRGDVHRISPEAPVPVVVVSQIGTAAGGAANVALNARNLGAAVTCIGLVGDDDDGIVLAGILENHGVSTAGCIKTNNRPTSCKNRVVAQAQQIVRFDQERTHAANEDETRQILQEFEAVAATATGCIISDYAKGLITPEIAQRVISGCRSLAIPVVVDPKGIEYGKYANCTLITPNRGEAIAAAQHLSPNSQDILAVGRVLLNALPGSDVLVTLGADGAALFLRNESESIAIPAMAHQVFDVTGAGDTLIAAVALALAAGAGSAQAANLGNMAAGIVVGMRGTAAVTLSQLRALIDPENSRPT